MNFFDHKDLENHLLQLCPKVVKLPVFNILHWYDYSTSHAITGQASVSRNIAGISPVQPHHFVACEAYVIGLCLVRVRACTLLTEYYSRDQIEKNVMGGGM